MQKKVVCVIRVVCVHFDHFGWNVARWAGKERLSHFAFLQCRISPHYFRRRQLKMETKEAIDLLFTHTHVLNCRNVTPPYGEITKVHWFALFDDDGGVSDEREREKSDVTEKKGRGESPVGSSSRNKNKIALCVVTCPSFSQISSVSFIPPLFLYRPSFNDRLLRSGWWFGWWGGRRQLTAV